VDVAFIDVADEFATLSETFGAFPSASTASAFATAAFAFSSA
jgi:hypothetical protein